MNQLNPAGRVRASELRGRGWINTDAPVHLADLTGKIVLLDFWTSCCINCIHVLDELRDLEQRFGERLVVIGIHSPKFSHERDRGTVTAAVARLGITHPVLDDPELIMWDQYAVRAWPTLVLIDPDGYIRAVAAGEGHGPGLAALIESLLAEYGDRIRTDGSPQLAESASTTLLKYPSNAVRLRRGGFLVADSGNHRLVRLEADGETLVTTIGSGRRGLVDGPPATAAFAEPNGLAFVPRSLRFDLGVDLIVADTGNHAIRGVRFDTGEVTTLAGTGRQWRSGPVAGPAREVDLSSPWDVAIYRDVVVIAMAGTHQLWWFDPREGEVGVAAGTQVEGLGDGPALEAMLAQPSALAPDGDRLWFLDAETSSLRYFEANEVHTVIGEGLFDFGHRDGPAAAARLQHPLGLKVLKDGTIAIADTYNGSVRRYDPAKDAVTTLARGLSEPIGLVTIDEGLVVVESGACQLTRINGQVESVDSGIERTRRKPTRVRPGQLQLTVVFEPAPGEVLDDRYGDPCQLGVSASPPEALVAGAGQGTGLSRSLQLAAVDGAVLHVTARAASCEQGTAHAACHLHQQDWGIPLEFDDDGEAELVLMLRG